MPPSRESPTAAPRPAGPAVARVVGLDLGQAQDPTALAVADGALRADPDGSVRPDDLCPPRQRGE